MGSYIRVLNSTVYLTDSVSERVYAPNVNG